MIIASSCAGLIFSSCLSVIAGASSQEYWLLHQEANCCKTIDKRIRAGLE